MGIYISDNVEENESSLSGNVKVALHNALKAVFFEKVTDHFISGVNRKGDDSGTNVLKPRSFCFTVIPGDSKIPGFLTMWIGVEGGSNNGKKSSGQNQLFFAPDGENATSPIPDKCSASIIFSHDIIASQFFEPNFRNAAGKVDITSTKGTANITVKPELATNLDDAVSINYNSGPRPAKWTTETLIFRGGKRNTEGTATLVFTWNSLGKWHSGMDSQPNLIGFQK
ncbi:hypothetical protein N7527_008620 [Penicillium freii]|nr:hypothetical protein N7527_008620 [Penicillium freii]